MKTKEELNAIKEEIEALNKKLAELNEEEIEQVTGGTDGNIISDYNKDVRNYLDGLINPEIAYRNSAEIKKPSYKLSDES